MVITDSSVTTPDVSNINGRGTVFFNHSSTVTVTNFTNASSGQEINVVNVGSGQITVNRTAAYLANSTNWVGDDRATLKLIYWSGYWYEISRSTANA